MYIRKIQYEYNTVSVYVYTVLLLKYFPVQTTQLSMQITSDSSFKDPDRP